MPIIKYYYQNYDFFKERSNLVVTDKSDDFI
jgi:hypothetical protein